MANFFVSVRIPYNPTYKVEALMHAAKNENVAMTEVLVEHSDWRTIEEALTRLMSGGKTEGTTLLLEKSEPSARKRIFAYAAEKGLPDFVELLLGQMDSITIRWALMTASSYDHLGTVSVFLEKSDLVSVGSALEAADEKGLLAVVELLRDRCNSSSINDAIASANANGCYEVVHLLRSKRPRSS